MAITDQQRTILAEVFAGSRTISVQDRQVLGSAATQDLSLAVAEIISSARGQSMGQTVASLVTGSVSSWPALSAAAQVADGATLYPSLDAFNDALSAHDANALVASAVAACLAAKKHLGV
jgi:hypothetical protein